MDRLQIELTRQDVGAGDQMRRRALSVDSAQLLSEFVQKTVEPFLPRRQGTWIIRCSGINGTVDVASISGSGELHLEIADAPVGELLGDGGWVACRSVLPASSW